MKKTKLLLLVGVLCSAFLFTKCNSCKSKHENASPISPWNCNTATLDSNAEVDINPDSVKFSFIYMGCNRVDEYSPKYTNSSTANVFQLKRTFNEVANMKIKPTFFFFLGDLVLGLDTATDTLSHQLKSWVQQFQSDTFSKMPSSGIRLIAVPGNHEMLYKVIPAITAKEELSWATAPAIWRSIMKPFSIHTQDNYGLSLFTQDSLTYSFNYDSIHFVLVNTDTYYPNTNNAPSLIPATWIVNDVKAAHASKATKHIFVMGHKPAYIIYSPKLTPDSASKKDDIINLDSVNILWPALEANHVEAMLTAHRHEFLVTQPHRYTTTQIIAGNGGSNYESHLPINNQFFGYTKIYVMKSGKVLARSFGRLTPSGSKMNPTYAVPLPCDTLTRLRYSADITWGKKVPQFNPLNSIQASK
jgi:hypothetical protein